MFPYFAEANLIMTYLIGIVLVASRLGRGPSILASIVSVLAFDPVQSCSYPRTDSRRLSDRPLQSHLVDRRQQNREHTQSRHQHAAANEQHIQVDLQDRTC